MDEEKVSQLYKEIKKQFIIDVLQVCKESCPEYLTNEGLGFLDGIAMSGRLPQVISKEMYDKQLSLNEDLKKSMSKLKKENTELKSKVEDILKKKHKKVKRSLFSFF